MTLADGLRLAFSTAATVGGEILHDLHRQVSLLREELCRLQTQIRATREPGSPHAALLSQAEQPLKDQ